MVDWYYIFFVLALGLYPSDISIYNVGSNATWRTIEKAARCVSAKCQALKIDTAKLALAYSAN